MLVAVAGLIGLAAAEEARWEPLFNGKDLTGWTPKIRGCEAGENFQHTFRVVDGVLKVDYSDYKAWDNRYGHLFYAKHFVNGIEVISYSQPQYGGDAHADELAKVAGTKMLADGYICLQSESHPVEFRKVEIQLLKP